MIDKQSYVARIATASPLKLVLINFEIILDYLKDSKDCLEDEKLFNFNIIKARQFLTELRCSLDMQYEISYDLLSLYNYIDKKMSDFLFRKDIKDYEEATELLKTIMSGFEQIQENDESPIMTNTDSIYAGLTYGKGGKLEEFVDIRNNKGFKA